MLACGWVIALIVLLGLAYVGRGWLAWVGALSVLFLTWYLCGIDTRCCSRRCCWHPCFLQWSRVFAPLRRALFARALLPTLGKVMPKIGNTERIALKRARCGGTRRFSPARPIGSIWLTFNASRSAKKNRPLWMDRSSVCARCSTTGRSSRIAIYRPRFGTS